MKRSDLILENGVINNNTRTDFVHKSVLYGTAYTEITVDDGMSELTGKQKGKYITVFCGENDCTECLAELLKNMFPDGKALVVGLGNERICSDSIGVKTLKFIPATAHLSAHEDFTALGLREVSVIESGVTGKTGIESARKIKCIASEIGADFVIAIDSLACAEAQQLAKVIQITDSGISPGAGVGNNRKRMNIETIGVPVIALGVPTVIDFDGDKRTDFMVTPRNIDIIAERFSKIIGLSISRALNPGLNEAEILSLIV